MTTKGSLCFSFFLLRQQQKQQATIAIYLYGQASVAFSAVAGRHCPTGRRTFWLLSLALVACKSDKIHTSVSQPLLGVNAPMFTIQLSLLSARCTVSAGLTDTEKKQNNLKKIASSSSKVMWINIHRIRRSLFVLGQILTECLLSVLWNGSTGWKTKLAGIFFFQSEDWRNLLQLL